MVTMSSFKMFITPLSLNVTPLPFSIVLCTVCLNEHGIDRTIWVIRQTSSVWKLSRDEYKSVNGNGAQLPVLGHMQSICNQSLLSGTSLQNGLKVSSPLSLAPVSRHVPAPTTSC